MRHCKYFHLFFILFLLLFPSCRTQKAQRQFSEYPKHEFRGAWLSTIWQGQYRTMSSEQMKRYFVNVLDKMEKDGINAVVFQVRPQADAFYKSRYEPWSAHLTGVQGQTPDDGFDPLAFVIEQCHQRNMELHAWLNPYRVTASESDSLVSEHIYKRYPHRFVSYAGKVYFDPGLPENRKYICDVVKDVTLNYQVDAIHMDDYFYPYPVAGEVFADDKSFEQYGKPKGYKDSEIGDWRRDNVNMLIKEVKQTILETKPWVRFGVSPFGIYRNKKSTPDGSGSETNGLQSYDDIFADTKLWVEKGWVDYNIPQIYWEIGHKAADYDTLVEWWGKNAFDRPLYIGQHVRRTMDAINAKGEVQLMDKMKMARTNPNVGGNCFWPAYDLVDNYKGVEVALQSEYHKYPALIPPYKHMHSKVPRKVEALKGEYTAASHTLVWKSNGDRFDPETAQYYVVYRFAKGEKPNLNDASKIVGITRKCNFVLPYEGKKNEYRYVVTAVDGFHNESKGKKLKIKL